MGMLREIVLFVLVVAIVGGVFYLYYLAMHYNRLFNEQSKKCEFLEQKCKSLQQELAEKEKVSEMQSMLAEIIFDFRDLSQEEKAQLSEYIQRRTASIEGWEKIESQVAIYAEKYKKT
jgi:Tfp pilus assembly protein PilN